MQVSKMLFAMFSQQLLFQSKGLNQECRNHEIWGARNEQGRDWQKTVNVRMLSRDSGQHPHHCCWEIEHSKRKFKKQLANQLQSWVSDHWSFQSSVVAFITVTYWNIHRNTSNRTIANSKRNGKCRNYVWSQLWTILYVATNLSYQKMMGLMNEKNELRNIYVI